MAKNKNTMKKDVPAPPPPREDLSSRGKALIGAGALLAVSGFVVLSFADARGQNWAALISPFLLIAGYSAVGLGLFLPPASNP